MQKLNKECHETTAFLFLRDRRGTIRCSGSDSDSEDLLESDVLRRFKDGGRFCSGGGIIEMVAPCREPTGAEEVALVGTENCPTGHGA